MLFKQSSLAFFLYLASVVASSPLDVSKPAHGHTFQERAVDLVANSTGFVPPHILLSIEERCAILSTGFTGVLASGAPAIFANYIASKIKAQSDNHSCAVISGNVDGVNYQYSASGRHCDTTSEEKTIRSAVTKGLEYMKNHNYDAACFQLTHGGTWKGLLQIAVGNEHIVNGKCNVVAYNVSI